jgi:hypothetical protein
MPTSHSYIPHPDGDFHDWANNFYTYALAKCTVWQVKSPQTTLADPLAAFNAAYVEFLKPDHSHPDVLVKNETRAALEHVCRAYYSAYISTNPDVPNADREKLRVPIHSGTRTPSTPPTTSPVPNRIETAPRRVTIHFHDEGSEHKAKPKGAHECEIRWGLLPAPPAHVDELTHTKLDTRTPATLDFDESQRGQKLYFCLRWIGPTGLEGPWGEIHNAIVP